MKKDIVKIKDNISIVDEITAIKSIVDYYFTDGEYTPYFAEIAKITVIAENFLDGVEFDKNDYVYECVLQNEDLYKCVNKFLSASVSKSDAKYLNCMERIMKQVEDIVEFKKQKLIHSSDTIKAIGDLCDSITTVLNNIAEMNSPKNIQIAKDFMEEIKQNGITEETLANAVRKAADKFKMPENEVIKEQRKRIAEQQDQLQEKEAKIQELIKWKRDYMACNVKSVRGSGKINSNAIKKTTESAIKKD